MPEQVTASVGKPPPIPPRPTFYAVAYLAAHHANSAGTWTLGYVNTVREIAEADARMRHGVLVTIPGSTQPAKAEPKGEQAKPLPAHDLCATCGHRREEHHGAPLSGTTACSDVRCPCSEFRPTPKPDAGGEDIVVRLRKDADEWDVVHMRTSDEVAALEREAADTITTLRARIAESALNDQSDPPAQQESNP